MISALDAMSLIRFTPAELTLIAKIENVIDDSIAREYSTGKMAGAPIRLATAETVDPKIAYAIKRNYETTGNWNVSVIAVAPLSLQFTPFYAVPAMAPKIASDSKALPPIVRVESPTSAASKKLLVRMPTRSRPRQALEVLALYRSLAGIPITIEVIIDEDDETMMAAPVLQRLDALGCVVTVGRHKSKVEACNAGRVTDWDILLLASDDMVPVVNGYASIVINAMEHYWPHLDGALHFNDGAQNDNLSTLPVVGRRWFDQWGTIYNPAYASLFCDTEQTVLWKQMGRLAYIPQLIIEHRHHVWGKSANDELYKRNDALFKADEAIFKERMGQRYANAQFTFLTPPIWLSVCIATLPERREQLTRLVDELYRQRATLLHPGNVEIVIDADEGSVGVKRQRLLERAKGTFICFVDDDDLVSHDYLARIVGALCASPNVDCVALTGVMTTSGGTPEKFTHGLGLEWSNAGGVYVRGINHLNPVRRELALQVGFPDLNHAEDHDYSTKLAPLLKTQTTLGDAPAYLYLFQPGKGETGGSTEASS